MGKGKYHMAFRAPVNALVTLAGSGIVGSVDVGADLIFSCLILKGKLGDGSKQIVQEGQECKDSQDSNTPACTVLVYSQSKHAEAKGHTCNTDYYEAPNNLRVY
jgi:hypothetical protein